MARKFTTQTIKVPSHITCDCCGISFGYDTGEEVIEAQEFVSIEQTCGYGSIFGDMNSIKLDMCQYCLKKYLGQWIKVTNYES